MSNEQRSPNSDDPEIKTGLEVAEIEKEPLVVYAFNDQLGEYEELEIEDEEGFELHELLDSDNILLFVDPEHYRVWVWQGLNTTTRMKFISAKLAPNIRDKHGIAYKVTTVDEGSESLAFEIMIGLKEPIDYEEEQTGPAYEGTEEDLQLLEDLSREKILLILEKTELPEGYERKMVIVKNKIYGYKEYERTYMDSVIKERKLFPLKEEMEDGSYLAEGFIPRMLFSFNNVILTELLKKKEDIQNN